MKVYEAQSIDDDAFNVQIQEWLQENYEPWETIKSHWMKTCKFRRVFITNKIKDFNDLLPLWPRYKKKNGFELIEIDFEDLYPNITGNLKRLWPQYKKKILELALKKARKSKDKDQINKLKKKVSDGSSDEENNFSDRTTIHALFFLCPSYDSTIKQDLDKMFKKVERGTNIDNAVRTISEKSAADGKTKTNPYILYFEDEAGVPFKFFDFIESLKYELSTCITALDILFKAYFVFHLQYPPEACNILTFIQHFYFQIHLDEDKHYKSVDIDRGLQCEAIMNNEL